jgi:hypothetical protein
MQMTRRKWRPLFCWRYNGARVNEIAKIQLWLAALTWLCWATAAYAQTTSLDREVKATPGRDVRVGIYTSMRADCTAGPLPAIRLSVAPRTRHCHRAPRDA